MDCSKAVLVAASFERCEIDVAAHARSEAESAESWFKSGCVEVEEEEEVEVDGSGADEDRPCGIAAALAALLRCFLDLPIVVIGRKWKVKKICLVMNVAGVAACESHQSLEPILPLLR